MPGRLGEREIIQLLTRIYGKNSRLPLDYDDDLAAVPINSRSWLFLKSDMLVASTDIPRGMRLWQAARKAVVATVSDFAAKGIKPQALMVSLGLPASLDRKEIEEIGVGLARGAAEYGCRIIGGDTGKSDDLTIDCMGAGVSNPSRLIRRRGAAPGDIVAVTGWFGKSPAGLGLLLSGRKTASSEDRRLVRTVLLPEARLAEGLVLAKSGVATSSIDSSDGLAWSLHEIARCSNVSIGLDRMPVAPEAERYGRRTGSSPVELALFGGEEYELVLTIKASQFGRARRLVPSLIPIGRVGKGPSAVGASIGGRLVKVEPRGYDHFTGEGKIRLA